MPMAINSPEEYEKVVNVSWFTQEKPADELTYVARHNDNETSDSWNRFPCVLPFSQMYPLCCIDIRNFLNQFYFFSDDHFQHPNVIDETLKKVLSGGKSLWRKRLLTVTSVFRRVAHRKGLPVLGRALKLPISGADSADSHQPGAF